jgi:hypothetical protein
MIDNALPEVGSGRASSQAPGPRLPVVSMRGSSPVSSRVHARAKHSCRKCPVLIPVERTLCYYCTRTETGGHLVCAACHRQLEFDGIGYLFAGSHILHNEATCSTIPLRMPRSRPVHIPGAIKGKWSERQDARKSR